MKIVINGKFMSQTITGEQRYAREILSELDLIISKSFELELAVDSAAKDLPDFQNITIRKIGKLNGNLWEQISLPLYVIKNKAKCLCLCDITPILCPFVTVIHDINFKVNKNFFNRKFTLWHRLNTWFCIKRLKKIITVSDFSKREICSNYHVNTDKVDIIPCAWQHFKKINYDENTLKKYDLEKGKFYFSMSSMAPNKNFKWIAAAAKLNPDDVFAISGAINLKVYGDSFDYSMPDNLKFLGYVSDKEAKVLMRDCKAFLFPTFYEGFGMPPMEALCVNAKAVVSDASCMREIFENSVYYIDPYNADVDLNKLLSAPIESCEKVLNKFSWRKSAEKLNAILMNIVDDTI